MMESVAPTEEELKDFKRLIDENRYNFVKLAYLVFPFGQPGTDWEDKHPYDWQIEEWMKLSAHLSNPATRYQTYRCIISSGNGAAKTAWGAMTYMMLMYTQRTRARITANTAPQLSSVVWPEYDIWFRAARWSEFFFEKFGTSIKAKDPKLGETWRLDAITWDAQSPSSISGLHNKGGAAVYIFEEAPGIPAVIWQYAEGAFTETDTIKLFFAFGNSDDPNSQFEQNMSSALWHARRIDTRTLKHIDPNQIQSWLIACGGNEDHDDFRVRVRGLPRKTAKDAIISAENVEAGIARAKDFKVETVSRLPAILTCDPAWSGGDETAIAYRQGHYTCLLEKFKLDKLDGDTHMRTFNRLCAYEAKVRADAVFIDQAEGTTLYTLAVNAGKTNWFLVHFAGKPNDQAEPSDSEYANIRAQMYYEYNKLLMQGGVIDVNRELDPQTRSEMFDSLRRQLTWTKSSRHKVTGKKLCSPKPEIKTEYGNSPDLADAMILTLAHPVTERLPENEFGDDQNKFLTGQTPYQMPEHSDPYESIEVDFKRLYD
jgi:hypothetical protein